MEKFIVSARKYRPATFASLIGQDSIARTLKNSIKRGQLAHAYLFCGPRGVGKTTTARIFAKTINCMNPGEDMEPCGECESCKSFEEGRSYCIHELDAASNNSVDDIRALTEKVMIPPQIGKYSVYIIDEVHMLSTSAFNAFLKTLEEPPEHAIFILATTEKQKIIPTILSRCQVFDFNRISIPDIVKNLKEIAVKENVTIDDESLHVIAGKADGAMRDALTLFDQVVAFCGNTVDYDSVIKNLNVLDYDYYFRLTDFSLNGDFADSLMLFNEVLNKGFNALYFIGGLGNHLRNLLVCKESASVSLLEVSPALEKKYHEQSAKCPLMFLFKCLAAVEKCEGEYSRSGNQRLLVEFMLVRLSQLNASKTAASSIVSHAAPAQAATSHAAPQASAAVSATPAAAPQASAAAASHEQESSTSASAIASSAGTSAEITSTEPAASPETAPASTAPSASPTVTSAEPAQVRQQQTAQQQPAAQQSQQPASQQPDAQPSATTSISLDKLFGMTAQEVKSQETEVGPQPTQPTQPAKPEQPEQPADKQHVSQPRAEQPQQEQKQEQPQEKTTVETKPQPAQPTQSVGEENTDTKIFTDGINEEQMDDAWKKLIAKFAADCPKLVKLNATLRNTKPVLSNSKTIVFLVGNSLQKSWIEKYVAKEMANYLRHVLENENVMLSVQIKSKGDVEKQMYLASEKEKFLEQKNSEVSKFKEDIGLELK